MATPQTQTTLAALIGQRIAELNIPPEVLQPLLDGIAELKKTVVDPGIKVGEQAPSFRLTNQDGQEVALSDVLQRGPVVLKFYRGEWCPICNVEVRALQQRLPEIQKLGASLLAVSPQLPDKSAVLHERYQLGFDTLSDPAQQTIRDYKLHFTVPAKVREVYAQKLGLDLEKENADRSWNLPIPATFVLDRKGVVRARHVDVNYIERMEPEAILQILRDLR